MEEIVKRIENEGYEVFIVGGYVRDYLLGIKSHDIDICTNAPIEEIERIFGSEGKSFKKFYSYHLDKGEEHYTITTYREELEYKKNKPIKLKIADSFKTDLKRRDFTINTFAIDHNGKLKDELKAMKDLNSKIIRTVGSTEEKFIEDKTRIIRAIRFACTLDFDLSSEIIDFLKNKGHLLNEVSLEYIKSELDKIFEYGDYDKFFYLVREYKLDKYLRIKFNKINKSYDKYGVWAQIETTLPFSAEEREIIETIRALLDDDFVLFDEIVGYRKEILYNVSKLLYMDTELKSYLDNKKIKSIIDIDIDLNTINKFVGIKNTKRVYKKIENDIINNKLINERAKILEYLKGHKYE